MRIIGCDLHASQQSIAILDDETGETTEATLKHEGDTVRNFYAALLPPAIVGIEATGSMGWFSECVSGRSEEHTVELSYLLLRSRPTQVAFDVDHYVGK
jgi:hypothetical protein